MGMNMNLDAADALRPFEGDRVFALDMAEREGTLACFLPGPALDLEWSAPVYCPCVGAGKDSYPRAVPAIELGVLMIDHVRHILDAHGVGRATVAAANELQDPENARILIAEAGRRGIDLVPVNLSIADACCACVPSEGRDLVIDQRYDGTIAAEVVWHSGRPRVTGAHLTDYGWKGPFESVKCMMDLSAMLSGRGPEAFPMIAAGILEHMEGILDGSVQRIRTDDGGHYGVDRKMLESALDPGSAKLRHGNMGSDARIDRRYFETADRIVITGTADTRRMLAETVFGSVPCIRAKTRESPALGTLRGAARYVMMRRGTAA